LDQAADRPTINAFRAEVGDMILKAALRQWGAGVFHIKPDDQQSPSLLELFAQMYREPFNRPGILPVGCGPATSRNHPD